MKSYSLKSYLLFVFTLAFPEFAFSLFEIKCLGKAVQIFENGSYFHPLDVYVEGYMTWEKVGDLMPFDYGLGN